jgi:uncharacterized cupin superfamily protein
MAATIVKELESGSRSTTGTFTAYSWVEPVHGPQTSGELVVIRSGGTSGSLSAGLWYGGIGMPGSNPDGTLDVNYTCPLGDETMLILEGAVDITVTSTGKKYHLTPGSILSQPRGLDIKWHSHGPVTKKFWVIWDAKPTATLPDDLFVGHVNDNALKNWTPFGWEEPKVGPQEVGEFYLVRRTGDTDTLKVGVWRTGRTMPGCNPDGSATFPYSAPLGDETIMIIEGRVTVVEQESGKTHHFQAGDVVALPSGLKITWTSEAPYVKAFFVLTNGNEVN